MSLNVRKCHRFAVVKAARMVAEDSQTDEQIAAKVGISRRQLARWKRNAEFAAHVQEIVHEFAAAILSRSLAEL
jgi:transcriptional regulator with XRE-family HTH domain